MRRSNELRLLLFFFGKDSGTTLMILGGCHAIGFVKIGEGAEAFLFGL